MRRVLFALLLLPSLTDAAPVPKAVKGENKLYVTIDCRVVKMNPDGSDEEKLFDDRHSGGDMVVSPDGKRVVFAKRPVQALKWDIGVREVGGEPKLLITLDHRPDVFWSADLKSLFGYDQDRGTKPPSPYEACWKNWSIDIATGQRTDLDIPAHYCVWALRPGGRDFYFFAANGVKQKTPNNGYVRTETVIDATKPNPTILIPADLCLRPLAAFPDGKRWVVTRIHECEWGVYTAGEKDAVLWNAEGRCWPNGAAVSPDGKRVFYSIDSADKFARGRQVELRTADADGKNTITILKTDRYIRHIDWR